MEQKLNRKIIILIVCVIVALVGTGIVFYLVNRDENKPEDVLKQYMAYIGEQKYEEMYNLLSEQTKNAISKETFMNRNKNIYEGIEVKNLSISNITVDENDKAKITYTTDMTTVAGDINFSNTASFQRQDDKKYYLNWDSTVIFPALTDNDKVRVETVQGTRGKILDRNGKVLAEEGTVSSIGFVPGKIQDKEEAIAKASKILDVSEDFINEQLEQSYVKDDTFVPIKTLSNEDSKKVEKDLLEIPGIMISSKSARVYPYGKATSHLLGYIRSITEEELEENKDKGYTSSSLIGKSGMEKVFEDQLRGTNGTKIYIEDSNGEEKVVIAQADMKNGEDVKLTIDVTLQDKIYKQLDEDNGFSVAMNPKTGEILAMVSTPTFNSNDFIIGYTTDQWNELSNDANNPMYTRYQSTWVPGSSFKPIIGAIGLTTGKMTANEDYGRSGLSWQNSESWGTYKVTTLTEYSGPANLKNALIYSDNIYFAKTALKIGADTLAEQLKKLGFSTEIPFEQSMTQSQFAEDDEFASEIQLADTGYGQGKVLINPIHMASIYSAFVNDGNMIKPYITYKENTSPEYWIKGAFSKEAANTIQEDLVQVVENPNGTAHSAKISGMTIAGKTGTAEIKQSQEDENGTELGWFNAFRVSDKEDEQLLIINMIEDVKDRGGSHYLLPKVKKMFQ